MGPLLPGRRSGLRLRGPGRSRVDDRRCRALARPGVGRALLRAVAESAADAGVRRISLSVERKNFARGLYRSEGYAVVDASHPQSDTMVKSLAPGRGRRQGSPRAQLSGRDGWMAPDAVAGSQFALELARLPALA